MRAARDHVHHRQRQERRHVGAERLPERQPRDPALRERAGHGGSEHGVGAEPREVRGAVERAHASRRRAPDRVASRPTSAGAISVTSDATAPAHALAAVSLAAVPPLVRLMRAGRRTRGHRRLALAPVVEPHGAPDRRRARASRAPPRRATPAIRATATAPASGAAQERDPDLARPLPGRRIEELRRRLPVRAREHEGGGVRRHRRLIAGEPDARRPS